MKLICDFYNQSTDIMTFKNNVIKILQKKMINVKVLDVEEDQNYKNQIAIGNHAYSVTFVGDPTELLKVFARHNGTTTNKLTVEDMQDFIDACEN